jgi:hypothetical protein
MIFSRLPETILKIKIKFEAKLNYKKLTGRRFVKLLTSLKFASGKLIVA